MRATEHASRGRFQILELRQGLAEIAARGVGGLGHCSIESDTPHISTRRRARGAWRRRRRWSKSFRLAVVVPGVQ